MKWFAIVATIALIVACCYPWVFIESKSIIVSGVSTKGTNFGKPGYFHFFMAAFYLIFHFTPRTWAKRSNLLISALNLAWAIRNFILISACAAGECPEKKWALWVVLFSSIGMLIAALFPSLSLSEKK